MRLLTTPPPITLRGWPDATPVQRTATARVVPDRWPVAEVIPAAAIPPVSHKPHRVGRASSLSPARVALSGLVHAAAAVAVLFLVSSRTVPSAVSSDAAIALVFAPVPTAPPPSPEVVPPTPDRMTPAAVEPDQPEAAPGRQVLAPPEPPPVQPPPTMPAPTATVPPDAESRPIVPAQPIPEASRRPAQTPPAKPAATAHATGSRQAMTLIRHAPSNAAAQPPAAPPASQAAIAPLVPPRPVAGMETNRAPIYPAIARQRGEQGRVVLRVNVAADGTPVEVAVMDTSGHPTLDFAALSAVRQWHFVPATQAGQSVAAVADVPVQFRLAN
jgi:protein TonB